MNKKTNPGLKIICFNRKASFNYFFEDFLRQVLFLKVLKLNLLEMVK